MLSKHLSWNSVLIFMDIYIIHELIYKTLPHISLICISWKFKSIKKLKLSVSTTKSLNYCTSYAIYVVTFDAVYTKPYVLALTLVFTACGETRFHVPLHFFLINYFLTKPGISWKSWVYCKCLLNYYKPILNETKEMNIP